MPLYDDLAVAQDATSTAREACELTILMPCLNEAETLAAASRRRAPS